MLNVIALLILMFFPVLWLLSEFYNKRKLRVVTGILAIVWSTLCGTSIYSKYTEVERRTGYELLSMLAESVGQPDGNAKVLANLEYYASLSQQGKSDVDATLVVLRELSNKSN